jgi:hypothetical protein
MSGLASHTSERRDESASAPANDGAVWIAAQKDATLEERKALRVREWGWSWLRLAGFVLIVIAFFFVNWHGLLRFGGTLAAMAVFGWCVGRHTRVRSARERLDRLLLIMEESRKRHGGRVVLIRSHTRPPSADLQPQAHEWSLTEQELDDLDLYAPPVGVFGLLNRCSTIYGARRLSRALEHPCLEIERIKARQEAVQWLEKRPGERMNLMAAAAVLREQDKGLEQLESAILRAQPLGKPLIRAALRVWSILSSLLAFYALMLAFSGSTGWAIIVVLLLSWNTLLFQLLRWDLSRWLEPWREVSKQADGMMLIAREASAILPDSGRLGELNRRFASLADRRVLPALCRWLPFAETGGPMHAFFNHTIFYDLHVAERIAAHVLPSREKLLDMFEALAALEGVCSVACFAWEQPMRCYAVFGTNPEIEITEGSHPLIEPERVVANGLGLDGASRTWIITGSNMAGKSTFLRMAGVNVLMAQMGGPCTARSVQICPVRLISDLRARDNLAREESYFLAEVRQLRRMVLSDKGTAPVLGLIDEPFRGTNSQERLAASLAVVQHLMGSGGFFLIATHEAGLTALADDRKGRNFHFQEKFEQGGAVFDYALRDGPATTRNALKVLEREGYPQELMERARSWMRKNEGNDG